MKFWRVLLNILITVSIAISFNVLFAYWESVPKNWPAVSDFESNSTPISDDRYDGYVDNEHYFFYRITRKPHETNESYITRIRLKAKEFYQQEGLYICDLWEFKSYHAWILKFSKDKTKAIPDSQIKLR